MHHQTILHGSLKIGCDLNWGAPSKNVDYISMPGTVPPGTLLAIISSPNMQPHRRYAVKGVWEIKWICWIYLLWQARQYQRCRQCRAASPPALASYFRRTEESVVKSELFTLGIWAIKWTMTLGSGPRLSGLVQEFGSITWPPLLCFSSNSSIKETSRTSLQPQTALSWIRAEYTMQRSELLLSLTKHRSDPLNAGVR